MAKVISGFPGIGKSYLCKNTNLKVLDSDSSMFSWVKDDNGNNTKERNPEFPNNYIQHIKDNIDSCDIILVSSHKVVRDALKDNDIHYTLVYPAPWLRGEYIKRYTERGSDFDFIRFIHSHWDDFIEEIQNDDFPERIMLLSEDDTLKDIIEKGEIEL